MHGQYLEQQTLTRPAGFYARGHSDVVALPLLLRFLRGDGLGCLLCNPRDKTPRASIWDLGHAPCLQLYERESICHVQWSPRDPLTDPSEDNRDPPPSVMSPDDSFILCFIILSPLLSCSNQFGRDEGARFKYRFGKICSSAIGLITRGK